MYCVSSQRPWGVWLIKCLIPGARSCRICRVCRRGRDVLVSAVWLGRIARDYWFGRWRGLGTCLAGEENWFDKEHRLCIFQRERRLRFGLWCRGLRGEYALASERDRSLHWRISGAKRWNSWHRKDGVLHDGRRWWMSRHRSWLLQVVPRMPLYLYWALIWWILDDPSQFIWWLTGIARCNGEAEK